MNHRDTWATALLMASLTLGSPAVAQQTILVGGGGQYGQGGAYYNGGAVYGGSTIPANRLGAYPLKNGVPNALGVYPATGGAYYDANTGQIGYGNGGYGGASGGYYNATSGAQYYNAQGAAGYGYYDGNGYVNGVIVGQGRRRRHNDHARAYGGHGGHGGHGGGSVANGYVAYGHAPTVVQQVDPYPYAGRNPWNGSVSLNSYNGYTYPATSGACGRGGLPFGGGRLSIRR